MNRFHNKFVCQTHFQLLEQLKNATRSRGMSAKVWGDLMKRLWDDAHCYDPQMRYQYFLAGLRNREWKAALSTLLVNSIGHAVNIILYKKMHLSVENDDDFADLTPTKTLNDNSIMMQMMQLLQQNQNLILQQQQEMVRGLRSPRRTGFAAAAYDGLGTVAPVLPASRNVPHSVPQTPFRSIPQGPDQFRQEGQVVCGRCHMHGCSRLNCRRNNATCQNCGVRGHIKPKCEAEPRNQGNGGPRNPTPSSDRSQNQGRRGCNTCGSPDHYAAQCPTMKAFGQMMAQGAPAKTTTPPRQRPPNNEGGKGEERRVSPLPLARGSTQSGALTC
ncbi:unnamed protein product [Phytophthora fragariaefolia]|uniref:Unnamed protein product n=1 Tax=Phytophthora fragariaefolia TaxID=1490495 RepID=A0A9W6X2T9_9STRA|nr:unnamed protein product [Phytophthora fragariaefolia]